jgi:putative transposase
MPKRLKRHYGQDHLHYLTCSCYHRQPWLASAARRDLFVSILEERRQRYRFVVVGYAVMPDHIHLLLSEPEHGTPSTVMQLLKRRFARGVLEKKKRNPAQAQLLPEPERHVWQRRFYDFNVWSARKRIEKIGVYASQSSSEQASGRAGTVALEQLPQLCIRRRRSGEDQSVAYRDEDSSGGVE